jgi:hypothetical protein
VKGAIDLLPAQVCRSLPPEHRVSSLGPRSKDREAQPRQEEVLQEVIREERVALSLRRSDHPPVKARHTGAKLEKLPRKRATPRESPF